MRMVLRLKKRHVLFPASPHFLEATLGGTIHNTWCKTTASLVTVATITNTKAMQRDASGNSHFRGKVESVEAATFCVTCGLSRSATETPSQLMREQVCVTVIYKRAKWRVFCFKKAGEVTNCPSGIKRIPNATGGEPLSLYGLRAAHINRRVSCASRSGTSVKRRRLSDKLSVPYWPLSIKKKKKKKKTNIKGFK